MRRGSTLGVVEESRWCGVESRSRRGETVNFADSGRAGLEVGNCNRIDSCLDVSRSGACRQVKVCYLRQISNSD